MKARHLIEGSHLDPEQLKAVCTAFDAGWAEIAGHFDQEDTERLEHERLRLAHAVLAVTKDGHDPERMKRDALQMMALSYRPHP